MLLDALKNSGVIDVSNNSKCVSSPTGFTAVDMLGATAEIDVYGRPVVNGGVSTRFYMKTGQSGQGKTTLAIQSCCNSVKWWNDRYPQEPADFIMIDSEDNTTIDRVMDLSHWTPDYINRHFTLRKDVNLKDMYNFLLKLVDVKKKNKDQYYVETPILNIDGKPLYAWAPTFILIDSIAAVKSGVGIEDAERDKAGELKEVEISGNIDAMREAKLNTDFIMKMKPLCNQYGIYLSLINHITQEQKMSMFDIPKRYLVALKPGEKLRGGFELIYQAYGIDRLTMKEKLDMRNPIYGEDIDGFIAEYMYIKSKNHGEAVPYRMVIDKRRGYMPELSDFEYLYSVGFGIGGAGASLYMLILPEIKFSRKTLLQKCKEYPELARAIEFTAKFYIMNNLVLNLPEMPDFTIFTSLPIVERLKYIYQYSFTYSGYDPYDISKENEESLAIAKYNPNNDFKVDRSNSYIDPLAVLLLTPDADGCGPYVVPDGFRDYVTPDKIGIEYTNIDGYLFKKEFIK